MERVEILVDGDVQGVGYRYYVRRAARKHKLVGSVENLEDGMVKITCEGDMDSVKTLLKEINIREAPIFVESIEHKFSKATGEFKAFKIVTGKPEEEMVEGFSTGAAHLTTVRSELREFRGESNANFKELKNETSGIKVEIRGFREERNTNFQTLDEKYYAVSQELKSIDQNIAKLAESISKSNELLVKLIEDMLLGRKRRRK